MTGNGAYAPVIPILNYHTVSDAAVGPIAPFAVRPDDLARHLDQVVEGGHTALTVAQLVERLEAGAPVEPGTVVVTFDDGFEDNLLVAAPLLADRRLPATVYVTTGFLAGGLPSPYRVPGRMLEWRGLVDLEAAGIEVGSHAYSHRPLDELPRDQARSEIAVSKALLETALGHPVVSFAYPHGYASRWLEEQVRRCGFRSAAGVRNALSHPADNRWRMARLTVGAATTVDEVARWLRGVGAPVAGVREQLRTKAWREARRASALCGRATSLVGAGHGGA